MRTYFLKKIGWKSNPWLVSNPGPYAVQYQTVKKDAMRTHYQFLLILIFSPNCFHNRKVLMSVFMGPSSLWLSWFVSQRARIITLYNHKIVVLRIARHSPQRDRWWFFLGYLHRHVAALMRREPPPGETPNPGFSLVEHRPLPLHFRLFPLLPFH